MFSNTQNIDIGFCLTDPSGGFAFQPPRTVFSERDKPLGVRAIQNCPAVNALERQLVEMPSPISLRLNLTNEGGKPALGVMPQGTFAQPEAVGKMLSMDPPDRWRNPKRPVIQLKLPMFFVTDEPCIVAQLPPFLGAGMRRWPGTMVASRYPLTVWPQTLTWTFEWEDPSKELLLKHGEPLCYFLFEFNHPGKRPKLVEAALTPELDEYRRGMDAVDHLTPDVEEIWESAKARRPERLMVPLDEAEA